MVCGFCGRPAQSFLVTDERWNEVVPERLKGEVLCAYCYVEFEYELDMRGRSS